MIDVQWKVEELAQTDDHGRRLVRVHETYEGDADLEDRTFEMPGFVYEAFIRARRDVIRRKLSDAGYALKEPEIDWSFLEKGPKQ